MKLWYTDGSGYTERYGAVIDGLGENVRDSLIMKDLATVIQVEDLSLLMILHNTTGAPVDGEPTNLCSFEQSSKPQLMPL